MSGIVERKPKENTLDKIRKYYLLGEHKAKLSEKQDAIRINVMKIWNLMINYHSDEQALRTMMNECNDGKGCSRAQAYRYLQYAKSIFGNPEQNWKEAERQLIREDLIRLQQQAIKEKDGNLQLGVLKLRAKIAQLDKDTDQKFNPEKLQANTYVLKPHPSVMKMIEASTEGGSIDFNNLQVQDIDYQEIKDEDDDK